jgi:ankyrin repeat protein
MIHAGRTHPVAAVARPAHAPASRPRAFLLLLPAAAALVLGPAAPARPAGAAEVHAAAQAGDLTKVQELVRADRAQLTAADENGGTPLHLAAAGGHLELVRWLLESGAPPDATDNGSNTPLQGATLAGHLEAARLLLEKGATLEFEDDYGNTALMYAAFADQPPLVELMLGRGASVAHANSMGQAALHFAARGKLPAVKALVEAGADVNRKDVYGRRPLYYARNSAASEAVAYLEEKGARDDFKIGKPAIRKLATGFQVVTVPMANRPNMGVLATPQGKLLIDTGLLAAAPVLASAVARLDGGPVRFILNTHLHSDHNGANKGVDSTATVVSFATLDTLVAQGVLKKESETSRGASGASSASRAAAPAGRALPAPYVLAFGGEEIRIYPFTGMHSEADVVIHLPREDVVCTGSLLLSEAFPGIGAGTVDRYLETLDTLLEAFPAATRFVPGHGRPLDVRELRDYRRMVAESAQAVRAAMAPGKTLDEVWRAEPLAPWARYGRCPFLPYQTAKVWTGVVYRSSTGK